MSRHRRHVGSPCIDGGGTPGALISSYVVFRFSFVSSFRASCLFHKCLLTKPSSSLFDDSLMVALINTFILKVKTCTFIKELNIFYRFAINRNYVIIVYGSTMVPLLHYRILVA